MSNITIFENEEFGSVRSLLIDGVPFFVGNDVAKCLGYDEPYKAINRHCEDPLKRPVVDSNGKQRDTTVVPESDVYSLIFGSKLESAKKFKKWVTSEVLPSIRKTGTYNLDKITRRDLAAMLLESEDDRIKAEQEAKDAKIANSLLKEKSKEDFELICNQRNSIHEQRGSINRRIGQRIRTTKYHDELKKKTETTTQRGVLNKIDELKSETQDAHKKIDELKTKQVNVVADDKTKVSATNLGRIVDKSPSDINKMLQRNGFIVNVGKKKVEWQPTTKGKAYCSIKFTKANTQGYSFQYLIWCPTVLSLLK